MSWPEAFAIVGVAISIALIIFFDLPLGIISCSHLFNAGKYTRTGPDTLW